MNKYLSNKKGYTLVEMVIVICIIAILAVMSLVSVTIINSARAKNACIRIGSEINEVKTKSKVMTTAGSDGYGLVVYKDGNNVINCCTALYDKSANTYTLVSDSNVVLSSTVDVKFTGTRKKYSDATTTETVNDELVTDLSSDPLLITFNKKGNCLSGYGDICFYKKNGTQVARIHITSNGSVDVR